LGGKLAARLVSTLCGADNACTQVADRRLRRQRLHGGRGVDWDSFQQSTMLQKHRGLPLSSLYGRTELPQLHSCALEAVPRRGRLSVSGPGQSQPLRELAAGRADLLAQVAGLAEGFAEGELDEPLARQAAALCRKAGGRSGGRTGVDRGGETAPGSGAKAAAFGRCTRAAVSLLRPARVSRNST